MFSRIFGSERVKESHYSIINLQAPILSSELLADICTVLKDQSCPEAQRHAAGTLRNLTVGDHVKVGSESNIILFPC